MGRSRTPANTERLRTFMGIAYLAIALLVVAVAISMGVFIAD